MAMPRSMAVCIFRPKVGVDLPATGGSVMRVRFICQATITSCVMALGLAWAPSAGAAPGDGTPGDTNITYVGRWDKTSSTFYASNWAGAYLRTGFSGTTVRIRQRNSVEFWASIDNRAFVKFT